MGYGVNRSAKKRSTTRRKKRRQSSGRARGAAKTRSRARSRTRGATARRAPKKRARSARQRSTGRKTAKRRSTSRARKQSTRLYTRYDPEVGTKVRVTADSWEYANWPSRKPSKKRLQRESLKRDPLGTLGTIGATAGKKAIERAGETAARTALRAAGIPAILAGARGTVAAAAGGITGAGLAAAASGAAILAAGYVVMDKVAKSQAVKLGDRLNAISQRFLLTQSQLRQAYRARTWDDVPSDVRTKAVADYKRAIATASSQAQGSALAGVREVGSYK